MSKDRKEERVGAARKSAYIETYGCQMNLADGELMEGILAAHGYQIAKSPEEADLILVNTCAIREHAEQRVLGRVGQLNQLKLERPDLLLGVTGCMAQRMGESLLEKAPYVDLVMGPDAYRSLPEVLTELEGGDGRREGIRRFDLTRSEGAGEPDSETRRSEERRVGEESRGQRRQEDGKTKW